MSPTPQASAKAASDSYHDCLQSDVDNKAKPVYLDNKKYEVFGYSSDPASGFHATAYKEVAPPHNVIIAYRGTDPDLKHHTGTTVKDAIVDYTMVREQINPQEKAAHAFTAEILKKAQDNGILKEQVTVAGHSLGGTLAEIEAWKFGLHGMTLNAYGAVDLGYGVPEGGSQITDYVVAGDVVSAGSHHFGKVVTLASDQDIEKLREARYIDALPGAAEPNPLMGILLSDHGNGNFNGARSLLQPENLAHAVQNYSDNKVAIDHFREDIHSERAEIAAALRSTDHLSLVATYAHLSPRVQRQIAEVNAATIDPWVQNAVERNGLVEGTKQALDQSSGAFQARGQQMQHEANQIAQGFHDVGAIVQERSDTVSSGVAAFVPANPLAAGGIVLGAKAAGYVAHVEAEGFAKASHLAGQAAHATGQFLADGTQAVRHGIEQGAHAYAGAIKSRVHQGEVKLAEGIDHVVSVHAQAEKIVDAAGHMYNKTREAVSRSVDVVEHNASKVYDTLTHPGQWFHSDAPATTAPYAQTHNIPPGGHGHTSNDPRHPDNPHHGLYNQLKERVPEASENRLLQFTDACNARGITDRNLGEITFDRRGGQMIFHNSSSGPLAIASVRDPSPQPAQSMQHIVQVDQAQAQIQAHMHAQNGQLAQQQTQGQAPGR